MTTNAIEIKKADGKYKTVEEIKEEVKELLIDELDCTDTDELLDFTNTLRETLDGDTLYKNEESDINDQLSDMDPWDLLQLDYDNYSEFFYMEYGEPVFTDNIWHDLDEDDIADEILDGKWYDELPWSVKQLIDEYNEVLEELNNLNPIRREASELLIKYTNCEADVVDVLQFINKIAKNDEIWKECE